jgi:hypothetical protein
MNNNLAYDAFLGSEGERIVELLEGLLWTYTEAALALLILSLAAVAWLLADELIKHPRARRAAPSRRAPIERLGISLLDPSQDCL